MNFPTFILFNESNRELALLESLPYFISALENFSGKKDHCLTSICNDGLRG